MAKAKEREGATTDEARAVPEPLYVEMTESHSDARYGKLRKGDIKAVDPDRAGRWIAAGIATESDQDAYEKSRESRMQTGDSRAMAFQSLEDSDAHLWDVNYRDAVTADPDKLQEAMDAGLAPLNTASLVQEDGVPLPASASFEDIMAARERLQHPDSDPTYAHTQSSVSGNRSHYQEPPPSSQQSTDIMRTDQPGKRVGRMTSRQIGNSPEPETAGKAKPGTTVGDSLGNVTTEK